MTITKEDIGDDFPAYVAGASEKKTLSDADKEWFVKHYNQTRQTDDEELADYQRRRRNASLDATDWIVQKSTEKGEAVPDVWQTYRQALRDLPTHENFPNLKDEDFPTKPS
tara:strand:+ start:1223 stop:1555 length:333 start_codon:yes stop_codon:yes gene_type:complete